MPVPDSVATGQLAVRCGACIGEEFDVDGCQALFRYVSPVNSLIAQYKFNARLDIGRCFGRLLGRQLQALAEDGGIPAQAEGRSIQAQTGNRQARVLAPVPMHFRRFIQRGYNQSWELTRHASAVSGIAARQKLARKIRYSSAQSKLESKADRRRNVNNSFCAQDLDALREARQVIIIDDVVTTMSTVSALARCLKKQGIERVDVLCVARAGN